MVMRRHNGSSVTPQAKTSATSKDDLCAVKSDLPKILPITETELRLLETYFSDIIGELLEKTGTEQ